MLEVLEWESASFFPWNTHFPNYGSLSWFWRCREIHVLQVLIWSFRGRWRFLTGFGILILIWIRSLVFNTPKIRIWPSILILKVQRTPMTFKSSFLALEDAGGSWLGFDTSILISIWSLVFDIPMIWILALSWLSRFKEHPCPLSPHLGLWRMLKVHDWNLVSLSSFG